MMQAELTYCPRCGAPNGSLHGFCGRCGQALGGRGATPPTGVYPAPQARYSQPLRNYAPPQPQPRYAPQPRYGPQPHYGPQPQGYAPPAPRYPAPRFDGAPGYGSAPPAPPGYASYAAPPAATWSAPPQPAYHPGAFGYGVAASPRAVTGARHHHWGLWAIASSLVVVIVVGLVVIGIVALRPGPAPCTGSGCVVPPPRGAALPAPHTYSSSAYHYTVRYYNAPGGLSPDLASRITVANQTATGINWNLDLDGVDPAGGTWPYGFSGMKANGRGAQQVVAAVVSQSTQGGGNPVYTIPNAMVGYVHGYGAVYDVQAQTPDGAVVHARYIVLAAVHDGLAIVFTALGPYNAKQQEHPNPADTIVSVVVAPLVNGVTFPGMPVR